LLALESPWQVRFNRVYFTNFRAKVWKRLIFEWIFGCWKFKQIAENWVRKETLFEPSMCVHTWDNSAGYTIEVPLPGEILWLSVDPYVHR